MKTYTSLDKNINYNFEILDHDSDTDWKDFEFLGKSVYPKEFEILSNESSIWGGWDYVTEDNGSCFLDDVIFLKQDNKRIGCAVVAKQSNIYKDINIRKNTLSLKYLILDPAIKDNNASSYLLNAVFDYARKNDYEQVEFVADIDTRKFKESDNVYLLNGAKSISVNKGKTNTTKKVFFRCDVDSQLRDISKAVFESFKRVYKKDLNAIDEKILENEIAKRYCCIVKSKKKLTKDDIEKIKQSTLLRDLSITLKDMVKNKNEADPTRKTIEWLKYHKVIKTILPVIKKPSVVSDLSKVQHFDKVERIMCGVADELKNEINVSLIKNNLDSGELSRLQ